MKAADLERTEKTQMISEDNTELNRAYSQFLELAVTSGLFCLLKASQNNMAEILQKRGNSVTGGFMASVFTCLTYYHLIKADNRYK